MLNIICDHIGNKVLEVIFSKTLDTECVTQCLILESSVLSGNAQQWAKFLIPYSIYYIEMYDYY